MSNASQGFCRCWRAALARHHGASGMILRENETMLRFSRDLGSTTTSDPRAVRSTLKLRADAQFSASNSAHRRQAAVMHRSRHACLR
jgi:hypothetical protein